MVAFQIAVNALSFGTANSFSAPNTSRSPTLPRISVRLVTGIIACAATMLATPFGSATPAGVVNLPPGSIRVGDATVPEQIEGAEPDAEQRRRIARRYRAPRAQRARRSGADRSRANRQRASVVGAVARIVAARARDVAVSTQDLVEEERAPEVDERRVRRGDGEHRNDAPRTDRLSHLLVERRIRGDRRDRIVATANHGRRRQHERGARADLESAHRRRPQRIGSETENWCVITDTFVSDSGPFGAARMFGPAASAARNTRPSGTIPGRPVPVTLRPA